MKGHKYIAKMYRIIMILLVSSVMLNPVIGQTVPQGLTEALSKGDAGNMSDYFHESLEMTKIGRAHV